MDTTETSKTLITLKMAKSIKKAFSFAIETAEKEVLESVWRDESLLEEFGMTLDSMSAAGLPSESVRTVELRHKVKTLKKEAKKFKIDVLKGEAALEDVISRASKHNRETHEAWAWTVDDNVFVHARFSGIAAGLDSVLTLLRNEIELDF